jgi:DNA topoisomerase-1
VAKNLLIVESPAKTRTLKKFLGRQYAVEASLGHIRDLVKKDMGIGKDYEPHYEVLAAKKEVVQKLRKAAEGAEHIFLAPDPDREGEAIAWHIAQVLDKKADVIQRVTFNEITRRAVLAALENPSTIDYKKVDAQQARRVLDRLMGFRLSPLLWDKIKRGLSAGRVQSVALKMVCERQAEIDAFDPQEYWVLGADLEGAAPPPFTAKLAKIDGKKAEVATGEQAAEIVRGLEAGRFTVAAVEKKRSQQKPSPPFITSRLQQEAARRFGFAVKRTMGIAQGLYEGREIGDRGAVGLITYMRTDSTRVADEAIAAVRETIAATYGAAALPEKPNVYKSKEGAQDAHEAIRPTSFDLPPDAVREYLKPEEWKLYKLIWDRFLASQMPPAVFDVTQIDVESGPYTLRASGRVLREPGFLAVYRETPDEGSEASADEAEATLPPLAEGEALKLLKVNSEQKFTQPPAAFSEATLVKALEENGIGRPSTYASILSTLTDRDYVTKVDARFRPSELGKLVNAMLQKGFNDIVNEGYTAGLEEQLDEIEAGRLDWKTAIAEFDEKFTKDLKTADKELPNVKKEGIAIGETCPEDGGQLLMRFGRFGAFIACSNYPECKYSRNIEEPAANGEASGSAPGAEPSAAEEAPICPECGKPMQLRRSRFGTFWGCTGYPECKGILKTGPKPEPPKPTGIACPECKQGEIQEKKSRRGKIFYSCSRYPDCKFALWNKPVAKECPQCGAPFLQEKTTKKAGTRLLCMLARDPDGDAWHLDPKGCGYAEDFDPETADPASVEEPEPVGVS